MRGLRVYEGVRVATPRRPVMHRLAQLICPVRGVRPQDEVYGPRLRVGQRSCAPLRLATAGAAAAALAAAATLAGAGAASAGVATSVSFVDPGEHVYVVPN